MLKLPKIKEPIKLRMHRKIRPGGILKSVTVTHEPSGKWYFSLSFEYSKEEQPPTKAIDPETITHIGLDMSLPKLYVDSNGEEADFFKPYRQLEKRIAKEQRKLSHMEKGISRNKRKAATRSNLLLRPGSSGTCTRVVHSNNSQDRYTGCRFGHYVARHRLG